MSKVYFLDIRKSGKDQAVAGIPELMDSVGIANFISKDDPVALKIHFGEKGNTAFLKPQVVSPIAKKVKECGGEPFWIDANTLYRGSRGNTQSHLQTAIEHGYTLENTGAEVIIADGPAGTSAEKISVNYKNLKELFVAPLIFKAMVLIAVTHFKGHDTTGFGGALKNIGMGLGSRAGKLDMHSDCENCEARETCDKKQTLSSCWIGSPQLVQEKMVEYTAGILSRFKNKAAFLSFIIDVSPNCDCYGFNDPPIVEDIGILASLDPVAADQVSLDLVGEEKFRKLYPQVDATIQIKYGEEIGLGTRKYELITL